MDMRHYIYFRNRNYKTFCSPASGTIGTLLDYQFQTATGFHLVMIAAATIHESRQDLLDLVVDILIKSQALGNHWTFLRLLVTAGNCQACIIKHKAVHSFLPSFPYTYSCLLGANREMAELGITSTGICIDHDNNAFIKRLKIDRIGPVEKYAMRAYSIHAIHVLNIKDQFSF